MKKLLYSIATLAVLISSEIAEGSMSSQSSDQRIQLIESIQDPQIKGDLHELYSQICNFETKSTWRAVSSLIYIVDLFWKRYKDAESSQVLKDIIQQLLPTGVIFNEEETRNRIWMYAVPGEELELLRDSEDLNRLFDEAVKMADVNQGSNSFPLKSTLNCEHISFTNPFLQDAQVEAFIKHRLDTIKNLIESGTINEAENYARSFIGVAFDIIMDTLNHNPLLDGMSEEVAQQFYKTISLRNKMRPDDTTLQEKIDAAKPFCDDVVVLWELGLSTPIEELGANYPELEEISDPWPRVCTATLVNTNGLLPPLYSGRVLISCGHVFDGCLDSGLNGTYLTANENGFLRGNSFYEDWTKIDGEYVPCLKKQTEIIRLEVGKDRTSRFIPENDQYKGITVQSIYLVPGKDMAFCVLNRALPSKTGGMRLYPLDNVKSLKGSPITSVGFGTGTYPFLNWIRPEYASNPDTGRFEITNKEAMIERDNLIKFGGWLTAKLTQGKITDIVSEAEIHVSLNMSGSDSGSAILVPQGIIGIEESTCTGMPDSTHINLLTKQDVEGFVRELLIPSPHYLTNEYRLLFAPAFKSKTDAYAIVPANYFERK